VTAPFPGIGGDANNDELAAGGISGIGSLGPLSFFPLFLSLVVLDRPNDGK
jgi:hypothetical protein